MSKVEPPARTSSVTALLRAWRGGNKAAYDRLTPLVYDELRRRARGYLRAERPNHTLTPTALVNEVYLRMVKIEQVEWRDRNHFFDTVMRDWRMAKLWLQRDMKKRREGDA